MNLHSSPDLRGDVTLSLGPDGRVYFHDLDPELIRLALAVNPDDRLMRCRLALVEGAGRENVAQDSHASTATSAPAKGVKP